MKMQISIIEMLAGFGCARSLVTTQNHRSRIKELKEIRHQGCPVKKVRFLLSSPILRNRPNKGRQQTLLAVAQLLQTVKFYERILQYWKL